MIFTFFAPKAEATLPNIPGRSSTHDFTTKMITFVVPDFAMSAGTIFCMSGNRIYMDYSSSLGPIDPQVWNGQQWVPALGYLDKVEEMLTKAAAGTLSNAEFLILQSQDLAMLSRYEQARNLTITLLKKWLVEYKWGDWNAHGTNPAKLGQAVTAEEKRERAEEVAKQLGDNKYWHSHGRMIGINTLRSLLRVKIEDYSADKNLQRSSALTTTSLRNTLDTSITRFPCIAGSISRGATMTIEEKVKEVLAEEKEREKNPNFQSLRDFYETMKKEGLVIKQEYTLPPMDTIGRSLFQTSRKPTSKILKEAGERTSRASP